MLLAARNDPAGWRDAELEPGRLFLVGDPKQSIYRFRRADIDIYAEIEERFRAAAADAPGSARVDVLSTNFRSRPDLVTWQNDVFATVIAPDHDFPHAQPSYQPLVAHRQDGGPSVITLRPNTGAGWRRADEARRDEAAALARLILSMVASDDGAVTVRDADAPGGRRAPRFRDVCLLVRNRTAIELYTEALDAAGVPYHLDSGRGFFEHQEVRDAAAILTALDDPSDEVAVVAALKSAPFAASDVELLRLANAQRDAGARDGKRGRAGFQLGGDILPDGYDGPLRGPIETLRGLAARKAALPLPAYVDLVLRETHLLEIQLARGRTLGAANLQIIVQRAADFAANEVDSLRPFVRWLSTQSRADLAEAESPVTEVDDDVVRLLTIHQAKGLEFPVVILAKMAAAANRARQISVVNRDAGRIDFQIGPAERRFETPGYAAARDRQEVYARAEERRLLYVAATRARDWLVLPVFFTERTLGFHADLAEALPGWLDQSQEVGARGTMTLRVEELPATPAPAAVLYEPDAETLRDDWRRRHAAALERGERGPDFVVPSQVGHDGPKQPRETEPRARSQPTSHPDAAGEDGRPLADAGGADSLAWVRPRGRRRGGAASPCTTASSWPTSTTRRRASGGSSGCSRSGGWRRCGRRSRATCAARSPATCWAGRAPRSRSSGSCRWSRRTPIGCRRATSTWPSASRRAGCWWTTRATATPRPRRWRATSARCGPTPRCCGRRASRSSRATCCSRPTAASTRSRSTPNPPRPGPRRGRRCVRRPPPPSAPSRPRSCCRTARRRARRRRRGRGSAAPRCRAPARCGGRS